MSDSGNGSGETEQKLWNEEKVWLWKPGEKEEPSCWYILQKPSNKYDYYLYADTSEWYCLHRLDSSGVKFEIVVNLHNNCFPEFQTVCLRIPKEFRRRIVSAFSQLPRWLSLMGYDTYGDFCRQTLGLMHFETRLSEDGGSGKSWNGYQECWAYRKQRIINREYLTNAVETLEEGTKNLFDSYDLMLALKRENDSYLSEQELKEYERASNFMRKNVKLLQDQARKIRYTKDGEIRPGSEGAFEKTIAILCPLGDMYSTIADYFGEIEDRVLIQAGYYSGEDE